MNKKYCLSKVEKRALKDSPYDYKYPPTEKIPAIVVQNFPILGKLTAMRFLEWVQNHPGGVISLPTGKTPEFFIKWTCHLLKKWNTVKVQTELEHWGINPSQKPDMKNIHFVQIDEFYPIHSAQTNSFSHYVKKYYLKGFGLDPDKALLIDPDHIGLSGRCALENIWPDKLVDLTLRYRQPCSDLEKKQKVLLERIDQWCKEYEDKIRELGGIGFFLGGIGPDGHIGFNICGSDHYSTTRLCPINYETKAAAATDLGGIETARKCHVITIGLSSITYNRQCAAIVMAAGRAKANVIANAIQSETDVKFPATALQDLPNARFYITKAAACGLEERQYSDILQRRKLDQNTVDQIVINLAINKQKKVDRLSPKDFKENRFASQVLKKQKQSAKKLTQKVYQNLEQKIYKGIQVHENACFLHTEPHHDDIMLGYFSCLVRHFRKASNHHHFMALTSGFKAVTNHFMVRHLEYLKHYLATGSFKELYRQDYFDPANQLARNRDVWQYLDGIAANSPEIKTEGCARRLLRNLLELYHPDGSEEIRELAEDLIEYFITQYPGKRDPVKIQQLKGMAREWEAECLWGYYGWKSENVIHMRLGFYSDDIFTPQPSRKRDVAPIVNQLENINPDIITVALDPEASGPDTHYKVLQVISEALQIYQKKTNRDDIRIWGYRNVWYRFDHSEANLFVPVSLNMFSVAQQAFKNAFLSQKEASFPSYEHDGPFSELAQRIQVQQYQTLKTCMGREWFYNHSSPLIRATRGFVFLKEMEPDEFYHSCRQLRKSIENY